MARKILQVIDTAYRATLEEQDDTAVWITMVLKGAGADTAVLLRGNAVSYGVKAQDASGLTFGSWQQKNPPKLAEDVGKLTAKGVDVYVVEDDVSERGLERTDLIDGLKSVPRSGIAKLFGNYDQIWHW